MLRSAASLDSRRWANCYALKLKFDSKAVQGGAGRAALASLFRTYFDAGGMQVQANVLDAETLRAAQRDPSAHPGIVVRVAGYCAYFNDLQPADGGGPWDRGRVLGLGRGSCLQAGRGGVGLSGT